MTVYPAIDVLKFGGFEMVKGRRIGLLTHAAACDDLLTPTSAVLANAPDVALKALYAPEHGLDSAAPNNQTAAGIDPRTGLRVFGLLGAAPSPDILDGVDLVVIDLQDVGTRWYTYIWSLSQMLELCGEHGVEVLVLDRPNPLGGRVRGLYTEPDATSAMGRYAHGLPVVHGMTIGELARYFCVEHIAKPPERTILSVSGWTRAQTWPETGLPWPPPSPAVAHFSAVQHYPGAALLEGTTLNVGLGTALPFEIAGAPGIDGHHLAERLNMQHLQGVRFRPHAFRPASGQHAGVLCGGVQAHITDPRYFDPLRVWLSVLVTVRAVYPDAFGWLPPVDGAYHFDLLIGNTWMRPMIASDARVGDLLDEERDVIAHFEERRAPYLLYG